MSNDIKDNHITETETFEIKRRVEDLPATEIDDSSEASEAEDFAPKGTRQSSWPVSTRKYYLSSKDKTYIVVLLSLLALFAVITVTVFIWAGLNATPEIPVGGTAESTQGDDVEEPTWQTEIDFVPAGTKDAIQAIAAVSIKSTNAVFLDLNSMTVTASRLADERTYPASLTKVMTLIVVVENLRGENSFIKLPEFIDCKNLKYYIENESGIKVFEPLYVKLGSEEVLELKGLSKGEKLIITNGISSSEEIYKSEENIFWKSCGEAFLGTPPLANMVIKYQKSQEDMLGIKDMVSEALATQLTE